MTPAYHQPTRLDEALRLVSKGAQPVAGATALYSGKTRPEGELVDITRLGLSSFQVEPNRITFGATCTLSQLSDAQRREVAAITSALVRLDEGEYGICMDCEQEIDPRRLKALPTAVLCADCARRREMGAVSPLPPSL